MSALRKAPRRGVRLIHDLLLLERARKARRRAGEEPLHRISPGLRAFVAEAPEERRSILEFVTRVASGLPPGSRVLDAGAGDAPYRELFDHCDYVTADWEHSPQKSAPQSDIVGSLDALPLEDESVDAVLSTQVLEHVPDPHRVLVELCRVLRPRGNLFLTVPLVGELHEEPYDFFRYTPHGLRHLLAQSGFEVNEVVPRNGYFTTLARLAETGTWAIGDADDGRQAERVAARRLLRLVTLLEPFDHLDTRCILPLGYSCIATRRSS